MMIKDTLQGKNKDHKEWKLYDHWGGFKTRKYSSFKNAAIGGGKLCQTGDFMPRIRNDGIEGFCFFDISGKTIKSLNEPWQQIILSTFLDGVIR